MLLTQDATPSDIRRPKLMTDQSLPLLGTTCDHHKCVGFCATRPSYRNGRKLRAVKVFTINSESAYLLVIGVPSINVIEELISLFRLFGRIENYNKLDNFPDVEPFTEAVRLKFENQGCSKRAKLKMDNYNFMGHTLHVCYAPEYETLEETRRKLTERMHFVANYNRKSVRGKSRTKNCKRLERTAVQRSQNSHPSQPVVGPSKPVRHVNEKIVESVGWGNPDGIPIGSQTPEKPCPTVEKPFRQRKKLIMTPRKRIDI